jgi:hypothetical protein
MDKHAQVESISRNWLQSFAFLNSIDHQLLSLRTMPHTPSRLDHDLALQLCERPDLTECERATCFLVALSVVYNEPVEPHTLTAFSAILRTTAAS